MIPHFEHTLKSSIMQVDTTAKIHICDELAVEHVYWDLLIRHSW